MRLMYTDGAVSYLDVLLSSTSFTDFLTRADSLKTIVDQDQHLLDEHKADKQLVVDKRQNWMCNMRKPRACMHRRNSASPN